MSLCYRAGTATVNCGLQKGGLGELIGTSCLNRYIPEGSFLRMHGYRCYAAAW
jgi:hypothetical protein